MADDDPELTERLLSIADTGREEAETRLAAEDPDQVATALLTEVACRAAVVEETARPVTAQFDVGFGGRRRGYQVSGGGDVVPGWADRPPVLLALDLVELLLAVYGAPHHRAPSLRVHVEDRPGPRTAAPDDPWFAEHDAARATAHRLVAGCSAYRPDLVPLAMRFGTDKWGAHWYARHYDRYFAPLRDQRVRILELGVGGYDSPTEGGASARMWKHYFRRGLVHGVDLFDKSALTEPRITFLRGDQADAADLDRIGRATAPLDIVIDDGSHENADVLRSFAVLFPLLRPGGLYVIEDLQTSYWPGWGGNPDDPDDPLITTTFVKSLVDGLHHQERPGHEATDTDLSVVGLHVHHNIAFIEKGVNGEQSYPSWLPRDENPVTRLRA